MRQSLLLIGASAQQRQEQRRMKDKIRRVAHLPINCLPHLAWDKGGGMVGDVTPKYGLRVGQMSHAP